MGVSTSLIILRLTPKKLTEKSYILENFMEKFILAAGHQRLVVGVRRQTRHKMLKIKSQKRVNNVFGVSFDIKSDHETLKNNSFIESCIETF